MIEFNTIQNLKIVSLSNMFEEIILFYHEINLAILNFYPRQLVFCLASKVLSFEFYHIHQIL